MHFVNLVGMKHLILDKVAMDRVPGAIVHAKHMGGGCALILGYRVEHVLGARSTPFNYRVPPHTQYLDCISPV